MYRMELDGESKSVYVFLRKRGNLFVFNILLGWDSEEGLLFCELFCGEEWSLCSDYGKLV